MTLRNDKLYCKSYLFFVAMIVVFFTLGTSANAQDNVSKNIIIINSYQKGLSWTDDQTDGILSALKNSGIKDTVSVEYMDWKNYPTRENLDHIHSFLKYKYSKKQIDLVVTTDDAALEFALVNREQLFKNAPVVFCGVNENGVSKITSSYSNVTGIMEQVDAEGTIGAAIQINPNLKEIYIIFDNTESGVSTGNIAIEAAHKIAPNIKVVPLNKTAQDDLLKQVGQAQKDSAILITTYYKDVEGTAVGFEEFSQRVSQRSSLPVYHLYDFGLGNGAIGGSMLSGRIQGEYAGKIAAKILEGEKISKIPINKTKTNRNIFDFTQLKRFNISLDLVPKDSQVINKPFSFFETYKQLVITVIIIFLILVVFICILISYIKKISKMKDELANSHSELAELYEDLTSSDEELKQQFDELVQVQESLASSEEQYSLLFEKMLNGFVIFEPILNKEKKFIDLRIITANPAFKRHTNIKDDNVLGKTWTDIFKYSNRNLAIYQKIIETGEAAHFETSYPDSGVYYLLNAFKINENQIGVVIDNITEYKNAIKEVRKLNEDLEQRVLDRTKKLQIAVRELEAFTYTVSHDLKSPLRAVDSYSRIIIEDFGEKLDKGTTEMILNIRNICQEMIDMIIKLLEYSTTSRSTLNIEEVIMEDMFIAIFKVVKSIYPERSIELKIETGIPNVMADRTLLKQVIYNVFSNAVKFTKDREYAHINVGSTITESEYIFYIRDNGVGFDMNYSSKLFGIFQRLHTSDEFEGSGIGLVTIKKIIEKHGGRTWIEGEVDVGATLYFTLPFRW